MLVQQILLVFLLSSHCCIVTKATTLPSNGLNRWKSVSILRGGETAIPSRSASAAASSTRTSSTSRSNGGGGLTMENTATMTSSKTKKKRRKKSSSSSSGGTATTKKATPKISKAAAAKAAAAAGAASQATKVRSKSQTAVSSTPSSSASTALPVTTESESSEPTISSTTTTTTTTTTPSYNQMPSIFSEDESIYDKYASCLAATEGLRRIRDSKINSSKRSGGGNIVSGIMGRSNSSNNGGFGRPKTAVNVDAESAGGWKSLLKAPSSSDYDGSMSKKGRGGGPDEPMSVEQQKEEYKRACAEYVLNSSKVIKALGLSVSQFNQLGREIKKNGPLKERVMEQAYLYRMASTINMDKIPLIQDPNSKKLLQSHKRRRVQMFVKSITEIEELRGEQMDKLKRALNIDKLPQHMNLCDPNVLPLLNPKVRAVIEAFPLQAEVIVKKYGLNSDEFNSMLEETRGNPIFRWRVQRFKKKDE